MVQRTEGASKDSVLCAVWRRAWGVPMGLPQSLPPPAQAPGALATALSGKQELHGTWSPAGSDSLSLLCVFQLLSCADLKAVDCCVLYLLQRYLRHQGVEMRSLVLRGLITLSKRPEMVRMAMSQVKA